MKNPIVVCAVLLVANPANALTLILDNQLSNAPSGASPIDTPPPNALGVTLTQGINAAERTSGWRAVGAQLECHGKGSCAYAVTLEHGGQTREVLVDASSAQVQPRPLAASTLPQDSAAKAQPPRAPLESQPPEPQPLESTPPGRWHALGQGMTIKPTVTTALSSGQIAGMGNVILHPKAWLGLQAELRLQAHPQWLTHTDVNLIYGSEQGGQGSTKSALQELRGRVTSLYEFYNTDDISRAAAGVYAEFAMPFHHNPPYLPSVPSVPYSAEEEDLTTHELLWGADLKFSLTHDRLNSELHNILFLNGNRIAPNLLTYRPMLGLMWNNRFALSGSIENPRWSLLTHAEFYFARKSGVSTINLHDGLGGTKREIFLSYGFSYAATPYTSYSLTSYGYNNLNRGDSTYVPIDFRDGFMLQMSHQF